MESGFTNSSHNLSTSVQLSCTFSFSGDFVPQIMWSRNTTNLGEESLQNVTDKIIVTTFHNKTSVTSVLEILDLQKIDDGKYTCIASSNITNYVQFIQSNEAFIVVQGIVNLIKLK